MKKIAMGFIAGVIIGMAIPAYSSQAVSAFLADYPILINDELYENSALPALNYLNATYLPIAALSELNIDYKWNETKREVEINGKEAEIDLEEEHGGEAEIVIEAGDGGEAENAGETEWTEAAQETFSIKETEISSASDNDEVLTSEGAIDVLRLKAASSYGRLVLVVGRASAVRADVYAYQKDKGVFREVIAAAGFVGSQGITDNMSEWVSKTPTGLYSFGMAFGNAPDPGAIKPYTRLSSQDFWVDDPNSKYYNQFVKSTYPDKDWNSAENLSKISAYKYAVAINYNYPNPVSGAGSAIFLHCSNGAPTAGCVSVSESDMISFLKFIDEDTMIVIAKSLDDLYARF
ncbi:MAG: L,D-transpeptidase family protein [Clostridiales bacterium]|jgi:L,D-peptidoglycan transpeptidase YkuD (ErfK/YbiS/YcfS/YnhG family)|nr:L,D-transpeptidase family protein [Clostridiales bacterium]